MEIIIALLFTLGFSTYFNTDDDPATTLDDDDMDPVDPVDPVDPTDPTKGTAGDDVVVFGSGADVYDGLVGNDSIDGGAGFDTLSGSEGRDDIEGGLGKDLIYGGDGFDTLSGGAWNDTLFGGDGFDDLYGGSSNDDLFGNDGKDLLVGGTGNDDLNGGGWNDGLFGGDGNDILRGGSSADLLEGGDGNDVVRGGDGVDLVFGGSGSDNVFGNDGDDLVVGSDLFNRELTAEDFALSRSGDLPSDEDGAFFADWSLSGTDGDEDADTLSGGNGNDVIMIGNNDVARGGDGLDNFVVGDWITDGNAAQITDFDTEEDIVVVFIADTNADAAVTTSVVDGVGQVFVDGVLVTTVNGDFDEVDGFDADVVTTLYTPNPVDAPVEDPVAGDPVAEEEDPVAVVPPVTPVEVPVATV